MSDERIDALVRRLDVAQAPDQGFVERSLRELTVLATAERLRDAAPQRRALRALIGRRPRPAIGVVVRLVLVAVALLAALWIGLSFAGGPRLSSTPWAAHHVLYGRDAGDGTWAIMRVGSDGSGAGAFIAGPHDATRVSHDGTRIASATISSTVFPTLYAADGSAQAELHPDATLNLGAMAWSPDGRWLAFEGWDDANPARDGVWIVGTDGSGLWRLTGPGVPGDVSPDGRTLLVTRATGLYLVDVTSGADRRLGASVPGPRPGYMPDGRSVYAAVGGALEMIDLATGGVVATYRIPQGSITEARLSPDGTAFAMSVFPIGSDTTAIWTMASDGTGARLLVDSPEANDQFPDWLP